jgi:Tfp pilus assembly pilus retraction ATPase PilT
MTVEPHREPEINKLFRYALKMEATSLHLEPGTVPSLGIWGNLHWLDMRPQTRDDVEELVQPILDAERRTTLDRDGVVEFLHESGHASGRFRVSVVNGPGGLTMTGQAM